MIFENARVVTMDQQRRVIEDGAVAVQGDRITDVGWRVDLLSRYPEEKRFDARGGIILPGLIDCHVHLTQALIRGCADDKDLMGWLPPVWQCLANFSARDGKVSTELCILEMLKSGTTAFIETLLISRYGFDGIAETVKSSGIRASLSKVIMGLSEQEAKAILTRRILRVRPTPTRGHQPEIVQRTGPGMFAFHAGARRLLETPPSVRYCRPNGGLLITPRSERNSISAIPTAGRMFCVPNRRTAPHVTRPLAPIRAPWKRSDRLPRSFAAERVNRA